MISKWWIQDLNFMEFEFGISPVVYIDMMDPGFELKELYILR